MIRITYILSDIDHAPFFENTFKLINKDRFTISVILLAARTSRFEEEMKKLNVQYERIPFTGKKDYPKAIWKIIKFLRKVKPDMVHTHLADASMTGLFSAKLMGIKRRIYTRHGGTQKYYFEKGKKYDRIIQYLATHIVATCQNVKEVLMEEDHVPAEKISIINLAFENYKFLHPDPEIVKQLKEKYNPNNRKPVIGVISRWVGYKGIQYMLPAYKEIVKEFPNALMVLVNARGNYANEINAMISEFQPEQIKVVEFESNIYELYQVFDIFLHTPIGKHYEAFGQIYIEALLAGVPSVITKAGIAAEIITHEYNALVVDYKNSEQIAAAIRRILTDEDLRQRLIKNGKESMTGKFEFSHYIHELEQFYTGVYENKKS